MQRCRSTIHKVSDHPFLNEIQVKLSLNNYSTLSKEFTNVHSVSTFRVEL